MSATAKVFWSGGSQAVRLPKAMRLSAREVSIRRRGNAIILEPVEEADNWDGFWEALKPSELPLQRLPTGPVERRKALKAR